MVDGHGHVLVLGKPIETPGERAVDVEFETARFIEDERVLVTALEQIALAARLGRPEQIVEVGAVPARPRPPFVALVLRVEMQTFTRRHGIGWRVRRRHGRSIQLERI